MSVHPADEYDLAALDPNKTEYNDYRSHERKNDMGAEIDEDIDLSAVKVTYTISTDVNANFETLIDKDGNKLESKIIQATNHDKAKHIQPTETKPDGIVGEDKEGSAQVPLSDQMPDISRNQVAPTGHLRQSIFQTTFLQGAIIPNEVNIAFLDLGKRSIFLRKILILLSAQLALAFFMAVMTVVFPSLHQFYLDRFFLFYISLVIIVSILLATGCCLIGSGPPNRINISLYCFLTIAFMVFFGSLASVYNPNVVVFSLGSMAGIYLVLVFMSFFTPLDLSNYFVYVVSTTGIIIMGIITITLLWVLNKIDLKTYGTIRLVVPIIVACIACVVILLDIKMILGGKRLKLTENEWLFTVVNLGSDVSWLFVECLRIFHR